MTQRSVFEILNSYIRNTEQSIVNLISSGAPWLAPLAPAYMTYAHLVSRMEFPHWVSLSIAAVVEVLGLSAVSTILSFWMFNRKNKAGYKKAPVGLAVFSFVFYLTIVITMNVALDATSQLANEVVATWTNIAARAMLTLLSVPAALILAVRTSHKEVLDTAEREADRNRRTVISDRPRTTDTYTHKRPDKGTDYRTLPVSVKRSLRTKSSGQIVTEFGVSPRTARRWKRNVEEENL